jgi:thiol-disulfide isomerase/thioredoxin
MRSNLKHTVTAALCAALAVIFVTSANGQPTAIKPEVKRIDINDLKRLLIPSGKPLVVNFWATWCVPCREEFPDLVKLDEQYKGKIDLLTVSLDETADLDTEVTRFLSSMQARMPAYLLDTPDADAAIVTVSKDWAGNLPLTLIKAADGTMVYIRNGKFRFDALKQEIDRALGLPAVGTGIVSVVEFVKVKGGLRDEARYFYENNWRAYRAEAVKRGLIDSYEYIEVAAPHNAAFDIILLTRYKGEAQFKNSETAFEPIMKELRPKGPLLKGTFKPDDFREIVYSYTSRSIFPVR